MSTVPEQDKRSVGAQISEELYWKFAKARAERHESAAKALEIAILLYLDLKPETDEEDS